MGGISFISSMRQAPKEAGAIREMIEAEFKGIQIQMMDLSPVFVARRPRVRGHPVYRTIGIKKTGTFRGMRLPGSVPVFFQVPGKRGGNWPLPPFILQRSQK